MPDTLAFRVNERLAVGSDALNTIVFVKCGGKSMKGYPWFDGASWKATNFVYRDKSALVRVLREKGAAGPENLADVRDMPSDLREWRASRDSALRVL